MIHQLNKNNQIEVNGISAVLLDERAKERIFVDTEDLGEPKWQRMNKQDIWVDLVTTPSKESSEPYFKSMPVRQVVRFKQPDRMEVVEQVLISDEWITKTASVSDKQGYTSKAVRQIFILKEKHLIQPPLTKEYSMNEIDLPSVKPIPDVEGKTLQDILGTQDAWPLVDVLRKLTEMTDILLHRYNYDQVGWEEVSHCVKRGKDIIALLETVDYNKLSQSLNPWVKTSDRLPSNNGDYLIYAGGSIQSCQFTKNHNWSGWFDSDVTHWMPLPAKPKF